MQDETNSLPESLYKNILLTPPGRKISAPKSIKSFIIFIVNTINNNRKLHLKKIGKSYLISYRSQHD